MEIALAYDRRTSLALSAGGTALDFAANLLRKPVSFRGRVKEPLLLRQLPGLRAHNGGNLNGNPLLLWAHNSAGTTRFQRPLSWHVTSGSLHQFPFVVIVNPTIDRITQEIADIARRPTGIALAGSPSGLVNPLGHLIGGELFVNQPMEQMAHDLRFCVVDDQLA